MENHSRDIQQSPVSVKEEPFSDTEDIVVSIDFSIEDDDIENIKQESEDTSDTDVTNTQNNLDSSPIILKIAEVNQSKGRSRKVRRKRLKCNCEGDKPRSRSILHENNKRKKPKKQGRSRSRLGAKRDSTKNLEVKRSKEDVRKIVKNDLEATEACNEKVIHSQESDSGDYQSVKQRSGDILQQNDGTNDEIPKKRRKHRPRAHRKRGSTENVKSKGSREDVREIDENDLEAIDACNENVFCRQESEDTSQADITNAQNNCESSPVISKIVEVKRGRGRSRKVRRNISLKKRKRNYKDVKQPSCDTLNENEGTNVTNGKRPVKLTKDSFLENLEDIIGCQDPVGLHAYEKPNPCDDRDALLEVSKITEFKRGRGRPRVLAKRDSTINSRNKANSEDDRETLENESDDEIYNRNVIRKLSKSSTIYYECKICLKPYKTFEDLRSHNRIHKGKNLKCEECNRLYLRFDHLYKHQISQHNLSEQEIKLKMNGITNMLDADDCKGDTDKVNNNLIQIWRTAVKNKLENVHLKSGDSDDGSILQLVRRKRRRRALRKWNGAYRVPPREVKIFPKVEANSARSNKINMCSLVEKYDVDGSIIGVECEACATYFRYLEDWRTHRARCSLEALNHTSLESTDKLKSPNHTPKRKLDNICNSPYFLRKKLKKENSRRTGRFCDLHNFKKRRRQRVKRNVGQTEAGIYSISKLDPSCKEDFMKGVHLRQTSETESSSGSDK